MSSLSSYKMYLCALGATAVLMVGTDAMADTRGSCKMPTQMVFRVSETEQLTRSATARNIVETALSFTQGKAGCISITFAAEVSTDAGQHMQVKPFIDGGALEPLPNVVAFVAAENDSFRVHNMEFVVANVPAGAHNLVMQFFSTDGGQVLISQHSTIVRYTP